MKKTRSRKRPEAEAVVVSDVTPREGDDDPIRPGDIVMLPDGTVAAVEKIVGADAYVVEWTKQFCRGPWIFPISELVSVS